jgi:peptidoglycan/LPS O-acetylase OafA/YrhL
MVESRGTRPLAANRVRQFDGIRGLAAAIVCVHHALLVIPDLAKPYFNQQPISQAAQLLTFSPLHSLWAGAEAVYLFFVLSGFVLTRLAHSPSFALERYYPSRILRLYGPTVAAVTLGAVIIAVTAGVTHPESLWLAGRDGPYAPGQVFNDLLLIDSTSGRISQLWSLQWEVIFSLSLPLFLLIPRLRVAPTVVILLVLIMGGFTYDVAAMKFLPMFGLGVVMASRWESLVDLLARFQRHRARSAVYLMLLVLSLVLLNSRWIAYGAMGFTPEALVWTSPLIMAGICLFLVIATGWHPLHTLFSSALFRWLGAISFSLYLVHEPIVVGMAYLTNGSRWGIAAAIALSFGIAQLFYLLVERPIHRWSQRLRTPTR